MFLVTYRNWKDVQCRRTKMYWISVFSLFFALHVNNFIKYKCLLHFITMSSQLLNCRQFLIVAMYKAAQPTVRNNNCFYLFTYLIICSFVRHFSPPYVHFFFLLLFTGKIYMVVAVKKTKQTNKKKKRDKASKKRKWKFLRNKSCHSRSASKIPFNIKRRWKHLSRRGLNIFR